MRLNSALPLRLQQHQQLHSALPVRLQQQGQLHSALPVRLQQQLHSALRLGALAGSLTAAVAPCTPALAVGRGDMEIQLSIKSYEETECPESLRQGRAGGALGAGAGGAGIAQKV